MRNSFLWQRALSLSLLALTSMAMSRPAAVRAPYNEEPIAEASAPEGFLEDINFKSFFEEVGLQGSESSPEGSIFRQVAPQQRPQRPAPVESAPRDSFIPSDPFESGFEAASSRSHFTIVSSPDDFYAQASSPFDDFYDHGYDKSPFAASHHQRDYLSPYAASERDHRRVNFEDYGPPKGFFDDSFSSGFGKGAQQQQEEGQKKGAAQESRSQPKYDESESKKKDEKTKKCETVHKDGMACEICKDDFGGFSEHCSHSLHSGKDQKYANTRRKAQDEIYNPLEGQQKHEPAHDQGSKKSASIDHAYRRDDEETPAASPPSPKREEHSPKDKYTPHHTEDSFHEPSYESSHRSDQPSPHETFDDYFESFFPRRTQNAVQHPHPETDIYHKDTKNTRTQPEKEPKPSPKTLPPTPPSSPKASNKVESKPKKEIEGEVAIFARKSPVHKTDEYAHSRPKPASSSDAKPKTSRTHAPYDPFPDHSAQQAIPRQRHSNPGHPNSNPVSYQPLNPNQNFEVLGKMVKQFGKKDRSNCKKRTTKDGMTCYVCPNKHGQVDEECMYENTDPKQGVHMMYKEESSY